MPVIVTVIIAALLSIPNYRDEAYRSSAGVIKQISSQQITEEGLKKNEKEIEELRSLQQKIKDIDDPSHYYVPRPDEC